MPCESCRIYQHEICVLQERIFALETEMGLHETLPMESSGKKSTFTSKEKGEKTATYNLKLNDTVSFPRLCNGLGAKPKKRPTVGINGRYVTSPGIKLTNRFLPLSEPNVTECNRQRDSTKQQMDRKTVPCVKVKDTVVLGDGAVSNININRAVTCSYPSATVSDITKLLPEVLARGETADCARGCSGHQRESV